MTKSNVPSTKEQSNADRGNTFDVLSHNIQQSKYTTDKDRENDIKYIERQ